jgi:hypothetical protein
MMRSAPFTKRPREGTQQLVRCYVEVACEYDGEKHEAGEFIYLDERHAWDLHHRRNVRVCTFEEVEAVRKAEEAAGARSRSWPRLSTDMAL